MSTPQYDALKVKVRDWSNRREIATVPESVIEDCLQYGIDDVYRDLRIPQLEFTTTFTVTEANNIAGDNFTTFDVPEDLIEFIYIRKKDAEEYNTVVYNQVNDVRSFLDPYAEQYSRQRYVWKDFTFLVRPKLDVGDVLELHYYRRLGQLDALYAVVPVNWTAGVEDDSQPLLNLVVSGGTTMYKAGVLETEQIFSTNADALAYAGEVGGTVTPVMFTGKESWNWLRDAHERVCIYAALRHVGSYLNDTEMEARYEKHTTKIITDMNREEKYRRARGGNVQINVNTGGLI